MLLSFRSIFKKNEVASLTTESSVRVSNSSLLKTFLDLSPDRPCLRGAFGGTPHNRAQRYSFPHTTLTLTYDIQLALVNGIVVFEHCSYVDAMKASPQSCLPCQLQGETTAGNYKVISMSLYGDDPRYTIGALRNAQRLPIVFPGWKLRIYYRDGDVLRHLVDRLRELGVELIDVTTTPGVAALAPMLWRMTVLDDPFVDVVLSRDADSRLTDRDATAVGAWLSAHGRPAFHCIRDHPSHALFSVNGGLWGARRRRLVDLVGGRPMTLLLANFGDQYMDDMRFVDEHIWTPLSTQFQQEIYCHDSVSCNSWVGAHPFTIPRRWPGEHVGQVYDAWTRPRQDDINLLLTGDRNSMCESEIQSNESVQYNRPTMFV